MDRRVPAILECRRLWKFTTRTIFIKNSDKNELVDSEGKEVKRKRSVLAVCATRRQGYFVKIKRVHTIEDKPLADGGD
jgi:hypothetical protein